MRDLYEGKLSCPTCGRPMAQTTAMLLGRSVRAWKCEFDGDELVHPDDAQQALAANKLKHGVELKIGELNKAPYVRFTKEFAKLLHKGGKTIATLISPKEIRLKIVE